jgi:drug/metabolite transporter (DMT)-like permease
MAWLLILNSIFFVATLTEYLICMKYITNNYDYKNEWFNVLLSLMFTPFYSCFFIHKFSWAKIRSYMEPERRNVLKYPVITGILYTIETVFVFYALNTVTLSYYTILRSGFIIFNIPWFKYLLKKPVTRLYYASCASLVVSHVIVASQYVYAYSSGGGGSGDVVQNTVIILVSCGLNSAYNNVIEYSMTKHGDILSNIDFQIIFQATYFVLAVPWAVVYTVKNAPPITSGSLTMYFFIAFGLQLYMFNKIYILNSKNSAIPANILLSGLDLVRRVIQLTYSFVWFNEPFDATIGVSLVFLGASAGILLYQYIRDYRLGVNRADRHQVLDDGDGIEMENV